MRSVICMFLATWCFAQAELELQDQYEVGLIVLQDGRTVAIRGDVEYLGDEVHFTDSRGERMVLPRSLVDVEATDRRTSEIRSKNEAGREFAAENDGSLYSQVSQYQKERAEKGEISIESHDLGQGDPDPDPPARSFATPSMDQAVEQLKQRIPLEAEKVEEYVNRFEQNFAANVPFKWTLILGGLLLVLFGIVYLITSCVLIRVAFRDGHGFWGFLLTIMLASNLLGQLFAGIPALGIAVGLLSLLSLLAFPLFILLNCEGSRLRYLALWLSPYIWGVVWVIALVVMAFKA